MSKKLNIVIFSSVSPYEKSGILIYDMYNALRSQEHSVKIITKYFVASDDRNVISVFSKLSGIFDKFINRLYSVFSRKVNTDPDFYMFNLDEQREYVSSKRIFNTIEDRPDLIIYTFPQFFLNTKNLYEISKNYDVPIMIFPVDMAPMTGGCHYFWECNGYENSCGNCPGLYSNSQNDISYKNLSIKKNFVSKTNCCVIGNRWILDKVEKSALFQAKKRYEVNIVINENNFKDSNRELSREKLNIGKNRKIIFFGAVNLNEKRKGLLLLLESLSLMRADLSESEAKDVLVLLAGVNQDEILSSIPFEVVNLGYLDQVTLPMAFSAADVFASPSIEDAGPMMVTQALMSGTPVVAFKTGSAVDLISNGSTGYLVDLKDVQGFKIGLINALNNSKDEATEIARNCRATALKKSSYNAFTTQITDSYSDMVSA
ncbi:MAG: glycosyltransferase [Pedobacter sp.]|nr:MAG: glycosyltransferase [Pedobacter sp.]